MKRKSITTLIAVVLSAVMLAGCGGNGTEGKESAGTTESNINTSEATVQEEAKSDSGAAVTLKVFSNLPDRKNGQGLVEQTIIDEYMAENPNVKIEVEALDEEAYKTKFKAYAMDGMPDVVSIWGQPSFLGEVLEAGVLAELKEADYADYGFVAGSLEGFKKDGALYGLPRNTDIGEEIRTNIRAFTMPPLEDGKGNQTDIAAWNGGGYAVSAQSEVKEEAVIFLNYMYQPDKLSKYGWENGVGMSAQDQSAYMTGKETELQNEFTKILQSSTSVSGTPINDCGPSVFKTSIESEIQSVSNGTVTVEDFLQTIGDACK